MDWCNTWSFPHRELNPGTVTHPSTNRPHRRATTLMKTSVLWQAAKFCHVRYWVNLEIYSCMSSCFFWTDTTHELRLRQYFYHICGHLSTTPCCGYHHYVRFYITSYSTGSRATRHFGVFWRRQKAPFCTYMLMLWVGQIEFHVTYRGKGRSMFGRGNCRAWGRDKSDARMH